jgi:hypothetical protein
MVTQPSDISEATKCAHPACTCPVEPGQQYCSEACQAAPQTGPTANVCACNHPSCALAA